MTSISQSASTSSVITDTTTSSPEIHKDVEIPNEKREKLNEGIVKRFGHHLNYFNTNLRIVANIQPNDKVYIENDYLGIHPNGWITSVVRRIYGYSRDETCNILEHLITNALEVIAHLDLLITRNKKNKQAQLYNQIVQNEYDQLKYNLLNAKKGLSNLLTTYIHDPITKSKLEVLINQIH